MKAELNALAAELHQKALVEIAQIDALAAKRATVAQDNPWYSIWWNELESCKARCRVLLNQKEEVLKLNPFNPEYY